MSVYRLCVLQEVLRRDLLLTAIGVHYGSVCLRLGVGWDGGCQAVKLNLSLICRSFINIFGHFCLDLIMLVMIEEL